jgi:hypothetical protein
MAEVSKQSVVNEICSLLQIGPYPVGAGSSEPAALFREIAKIFEIDISRCNSKPEIAQEIALQAGLNWEHDFDSRSSVSGGGSTVTLKGLRQVNQAVRILLTQRERTKDLGDFLIDIQPDASALKLFKSMSFTAWYALGEFVDNSITSALKNIDLLKAIHTPEYKLKVDINFDLDDDSLTIVDNAAGIRKEEFARAMRTSEPPPDTSVGLGLHGVGMKAAAFWWGKVLEIETQPLGEEHGWKVRVDLDDISSGSRGLAKVEPIAKRSSPGTTIRVQGLWNGAPKGKTPSAIRRYLPSIYRSYLSSDVGGPELEMELRYQDTQLKFSAPPVLSAPFWPDPNGPGRDSGILLWRDDLRIELSGGQVITGWVAILEKMSRDLSGFFLHYRGKGVAGVVPSAGDDDDDDTDVRSTSYKPKEIFGQSGSYRDQSFVGEFDVSDFGKTITTDSVMWTPEQESEFVHAVVDFLQTPSKNYWDQAANMRRRSRPAKDAKDDEQIVVELTSEVSEQLHKFGFSHEAVETLDEVFEVVEGTLEESLDSESFVIADKEKHQHLFEVILGSDSQQPFLRVNEDSRNGKHRIYINLQHPSLSSLPPLHGPLRKLVVLWGLSIGVAEVFLEGLEPHRLRSKMNDVLEKFGGRSDES